MKFFQYCLRPLAYTWAELHLVSKLYLFKFKIKCGKKLRCLNTKGKYGKVTDRWYGKWYGRFRFCLHLLKIWDICFNSLIQCINTGRFWWQNDVFYTGSISVVPDKSPWRVLARRTCSLDIGFRHMLFCSPGFGGPRMGKRGQCRVNLYSVDIYLYT